MYLFAPEGGDVAEDPPPEMGKLAALGYGALSALPETPADGGFDNLSKNGYKLQQVGRATEVVPNSPSDTAYDDTPLSRADYEKSAWATKGGWYPGITNIQARLLQDKQGAIDAENEKAQAWHDHPGYFIAGGIGAQVANPLNYIPFMDALKIGVFGKDILQLGRIGENVARGAAQGGAFAAASQGLEQIEHGDGDATQILLGMAGGALLNGALGAWADHAQVPYTRRVAGLAKAIDQIGAGEPVDVSETIMPTAQGAEGINSMEEPEPTPPEEPGMKRVYNSGTGKEDLWTSDKKRAKDYGGDGSRLQYLDIPEEQAELLRTAVGSEPRRLANAAQNQPTTTDYWLGEKEHLKLRSHAAPFIEKSESPVGNVSFAPIGQDVSGETPPPFKPGEPIETETPAEQAAGEKPPVFSKTNQRVLDHETDAASHDNDIATAYEQAAECRYGR